VQVIEVGGVGGPLGTEVWHGDTAAHPVRGFLRLGVPRIA